MKILLQRVTTAQVTIGCEVIGRIDRGLLLLVGFGKDDELHAEKFTRIANKIIHLRIFENELGKLDKSLIDIGGAILAVPQFTLYSDLTKGRRPAFPALQPDLANEYFTKLVNAFRHTRIDQVECGKFGADMQVLLTNDGPFTLLLEY